MQDSENVYLQGAQLGVPMELRLYPEALLTGTVLGPDGVPLPQIAVNAQRKYFDDTGHRWLQVGQDQTDSHGNFRIPVQAGEYRIANAVYAAGSDDGRSCFACDSYRAMVHLELQMLIRVQERRGAAF